MSKKSSTTNTQQVNGADSKDLEALLAHDDFKTVVAEIRELWCRRHPEAQWLAGRPKKEEKILAAIHRLCEKQPDILTSKKISNNYIVEQIAKDLENGTDPASKNTILKWVKLSRLSLKTASEMSPNELQWAVRHDKEWAQMMKWAKRFCNPDVQRTWNTVTTQLCRRLDLFMKRVRDPDFKRRLRRHLANHTPAPSNRNSRKRA